MESKIRLGKQQLPVLMHQLQQDCKFLTDCNIMDHSLLLGIYEGPPKKEVEIITLEMINGPLLKREGGGLVSAFQTHCGGVQGILNSRSQSKGKTINETYFIGIIDILQEYNLKKKVESAVKGFRYSKKDISAIESSRYSERFLAFLQDHME